MICLRVMLFGNFDNYVRTYDGPCVYVVIYVIVNICALIVKKITPFL